MEVEVKIHNRKGYNDFFGTRDVDPRLLKRAGVKGAVKGSGLDGMRSIVYNFDPDATEVIEDHGVTWYANVTRIQRLKMLAVLRPFKGQFRSHDGLDLVVR